MTTRYRKDDATVAHVYIDPVGRAELQEGDEVIVSVNYGQHRLREYVTKRTPAQVTLSNGSRYSLRTGKKIGTAESYTAPAIIGRPRYTPAEAAQINVAVAAEAQAAKQAAELADILDRVEALADKRGAGIGEVLEDLNQLNIQRLGDAIRANESAKQNQEN